jgi:hypothetical protein
MRRASSRVSLLVSERRAGLVLEVEVPERLPSAVADDEAGVVRLIDRPGRRGNGGQGIPANAFIRAKTGH